MGYKLYQGNDKECDDETVEGRWDTQKEICLPISRYVAAAKSSPGKIPPPNVGDLSNASFR